MSTDRAEIRGKRNCTRQGQLQAPEELAGGERNRLTETFEVGSGIWTLPYYPSVKVLFVKQGSLVSSPTQQSLSPPGPSVQGRSCLLCSQSCSRGDSPQCPSVPPWPGLPWQKHWAIAPWFSTCPCCCCSCFQALWGWGFQLQLSNWPCRSCHADVPMAARCPSPLRASGSLGNAAHGMGIKLDLSVRYPIFKESKAETSFLGRGDLNWIPLLSAASNFLSREQLGVSPLQIPEVQAQGS